LQNVLLIVVDDLSPVHVSAYNPTGFSTPSLEHLAINGARYRHAWAALTCMPTRVTMLTGIYGPRIGYTETPSTRPVLPDTFHQQGTFAHILRDLGYATAVTGKWQHTVSPEDCGFDHHLIWPRFLNVDRRHSRYWQPYLVEDGHPIATGPNDFGPDLCAIWTMRFLATHRPAMVLHNELLVHTETDRLLGPGERIIPVPGMPRNREGTLEACVSYWDSVLGRMTSTLDPETVTLVTSDNATEGLAKGSLDRDRGARTILVAHGASVVPGDREQLIDASDWYPTILAVTGTASLLHDGQSFAPSLRDPGHVSREWIYSWLGERDLARTRHWLLDGNSVLWQRRGGIWQPPPFGSFAAVQARRQLIDAIASIREG
jgi:arylsulfatase A